MDARGLLRHLAKSPDGDRRDSAFLLRFKPLCSGVFVPQSKNKNITAIRRLKSLVDVEGLKPPTLSV